MHTLALISLLATATCQNDTIIRTIQPDSVVIIESGQTTQMRIFGKKDDPSYTFNYTKTNNTNSESTIEEHTAQWDFSILGHPKDTNKKSGITVNGFDFIRLGAALPVDMTGEIPSKAGLSASADIVNMQFNLPSGRDAFYVGVGYDMNYLFSRKNLRWTKANGQPAVNPHIEGATHHRSTLGTWALTLPLRYEHTFSSSFALDFCVEPQWVATTTAINRYRLGANHITDRYYKIGGLDRFNVAFSAGCQFNQNFGFYVKFAPFNSFSSSSPVNYKLLTFGFSL